MGACACKVVVPREFFMIRHSDIMKEVSCLLTVKQLTTMSHDPASNGLVVHLNDTLKTLLKTLYAKKTKKCDRHIADTVQTKILLQTSCGKRHHQRKTLEQPFCL